MSYIPYVRTSEGGRETGTDGWMSIWRPVWGNRELKLSINDIDVINDHEATVSLNI